MSNETRGATVDFLQLTKGTLVASILECLASGNYVASPEEPVVDGETIIGELTDLEKAIYSVRDQIADSHNEWARSVNGSIIPGTKEFMKLRANKERHEIVDRLLWLIIKDRLGDIARECDGIALRQGYKITTTGSDMMEALSSLASLFESIQSCDGNCVNCGDAEKGHC